MCADLSILVSSALPVHGSLALAPVEIDGALNNTLPQSSRVTGDELVPTAAAAAGRALSEQWHCAMCTRCLRLLAVLI